MIRFSVKLLRSQGKRAELLLFLLAMVIAISSVTAVSLTADRLNQALQISSRDYIAADRVLETSQAVDKQWLRQAEHLGLLYSITTRFNSMIFTAQGFQLASVRAVDSHYPLRGQLQLSPQAAVLPGQIWLSASLLSRLQVEPGAEVEVGNIKLRVAGQLVKQPDAGFSPVSLAPSAMVHQDDLVAMGVLIPGSRVSWRYLFAGAPQPIATFEQWLTPQLKPGQRFYGAGKGNTPMARPLQNAARFFSIAAIAGVLLGTLAMGITLRYYAKSQFDTVALLKTLGASLFQVRTIFWGLLLAIFCVGTVVGAGLGWVGHLLLISALGDLIPEQLPAPGLMPLVLTIAMALLITLITAYSPLSRLLTTPPLRVLRRELAVDIPHLSGWLVLVVGPLLLVWLLSGDLLISLALLAGIALVMLLVALLAWGILLLSHNITRRGPLHIALQRLRRHRWQTMLQLAGMATALLLMAMVLNIRDDLNYIWQQRLPDNAPNRFMMNIAPTEASAVKQTLSSNGVQVSDMLPMLRTRLVEVNGHSLSRWFDGPPPERVDRERNLTWVAALPAGNRVVEGQWWTTDVQTAQISLEQGFAERIRASIGDKLTFMVDGESVTAPVTSIRTVAWETMQPNFFIIFSPGMIERFSATYLASFYLSPEQTPLEAAIAHAFPTTSVINVETIIAQLDEILTRVSRALGLMAAMVLVAALLVMLALLQVSMIERQQEWVLMRTLGAQTPLLKRALRWELLLSGLISGLVSALAVELVSGLLNHFWLEVPWRFHAGNWLLLPAIGAMLSLTCGSLQLRPILNHALIQKVKAF